MRTGVLVMLLGTILKGGDAAATANSVVDVHVEGCTAPRALSDSEYLADRMFSAAGVRIAWKTGAPRPGDPIGGRRIRVHFVTAAGPADHPGALAHALPYEGSRIRIFYDRVRTGDPGSTRVLLAHVLVHEITHILEGIERHSLSGVMKAHWTLDDYNAMLWRPLAFAPDDIDLIRSGMNVRRYCDATP